MKTQRVLIFAGICLMGLLIYASIVDFKEWERYAKENNCQEKGYVSGSSGVGIGQSLSSKGGVAVVSTYTPGKTRYICDDNVEIYR